MRAMSAASAAARDGAGALRASFCARRLRGRTAGRGHGRGAICSRRLGRWRRRSEPGVGQRRSLGRSRGFGRLDEGGEIEKVGRPRLAASGPGRRRGRRARPPPRAASQTSAWRGRGGRRRATARRLLSLDRDRDDIGADVQPVAVAQEIGRVEAVGRAIDERAIGRNVVQPISAIAKADLAMLARRRSGSGRARVQSRWASRPKSSPRPFTSIRNGPPSGRRSTFSIESRSIMTTPKMAYVKPKPFVLLNTLSQKRWSALWIRQTIFPPRNIFLPAPSRSPQLFIAQHLTQTRVGLQRTTNGPERPRRGQ